MVDMTGADRDGNNRLEPTGQGEFYTVCYLLGCFVYQKDAGLALRITVILATAKTL